jgi:diacylglycerol kinase (ATP)
MWPETNYEALRKISQMNKRALVVANPNAGSMHLDEFTERLTKIFASRGSTYELHRTRPGGDLRCVIRAAIRDGYDLIAAAGGDGTVSRVADGLVGKKTPLGILPCGTGNVLANKLGIPPDTESAARLLLEEHQHYRMDGMVVEDRIYLLDLSVGIISKTMAMTDQESKRRFGKLAYLWKGATLLSSLQPEEFWLEVDGNHLSTRAAEILVKSNQITGINPFNSDEMQTLGDGIVHIHIIRANSVAGFVKSMIDLARGRAGQAGSIQCLEARKHIYIEGIRTSQPVQADGESIGDTPVQITIIPDAVRIIVPPGTGS